MTSVVEVSEVGLDEKGPGSAGTEFLNKEGSGLGVEIGLRSRGLSITGSEAALTGC